MTVGQLSMAVDSKRDRIYLCSLIDTHEEALVEITMSLRALPGVMSMEVYTLAYRDDGFVATVGMPIKALQALDLDEEKVRD